MGGGLETKAGDGGVRGRPFCLSLPSWRTKRPRQGPDVTYRTLPSQLPYFLSPPD